MPGCNCRVTRLQLQIAITLCKLPAQEGIGAKMARLQLQIAGELAAAHALPQLPALGYRVKRCKLHTA